jgi:LacI family kdg operon repressor
VLVTEPLGLVSSRIERARAFEQYAGGEGRAAGVIESPPDDPDVLLKALRTLRRRRGAGRPAIITANAVITLQVVEAIARLGWQLGEDIGLVGIDDTPWAPYVGPGISAMAQPTDRIGELAAKCLLQRIGGLDDPAREIRLPGIFMARGSTASGI